MKTYAEWLLDVEKPSCSNCSNNSGNRCCITKNIVSKAGYCKHHDIHKKTKMNLLTPRAADEDKPVGKTQVYD